MCITDVYSGWTERFAMKNNAFVWVRQGLDVAKSSFPFTFTHLHPDNGSEFINYAFVDWAKNQVPPVKLDFYPSQKLIFKTRIGSKVVKKYDTAKTPVQRILDFPNPDEHRQKAQKIILKRLEILDPLVLTKRVQNLLRKLHNQCVKVDKSG